MYNSYFGFSESPFNVTPDPRFFYTNHVYREAFSALRYGIEAKKGFIVITGEVGTGKTTLLRKLMRTVGETIHSVFIFNTLVGFGELLQLILHDLGLTPKEPSKVAMLQELNEYLIMQLKRGHVVSVLIDEAQNLNDEALEGLRLLSNLETDQEKLLQIVLMGQPELKAKLDQPGLRQLKQRVAFQCQLTPLKPEETGAYIDLRLKAVGYAGRDLFPPDAVLQIAFFSEGIPRLINIICDNALLNAYAESKNVVSAQMIQEVGRDLRLGPEVQVVPTSPGRISKSGQEPGRPLPRRFLPHEKRGAVVAATGSVLAILFFIALASLVNPRNFQRIVAERLETSKHNLHQWVAVVTRPGTASEEAIVEAATDMPVIENEEKPRRVLIQYGSTISKLASDVYGATSFLALDIIKEFNPQIANLNSVYPGQELLLPPLTQETMLRQQPDGSHRLIAASFPSRTEAADYARLLSDVGFHAVITPRRVSDDLLLQRVEIADVKSFEELDRTWNSGPND